MIELALGRDRVRRRERTGATTSPGMDARRVLQLILAATWLLDGLLQYQSSMYSTMFGEMIGDSATGNPGVIASPISWNAVLVEHHLVLLNTVFATIQLLLGLGIAYRPTVRVALAASIAWSLGVWWFGEGLGGVLSGGASPVNGAPGAVILYALLAVLLWPADRPGVTAPFVAARAVGAPVARLLWLVLWGSLAYFALTPANRAPQALHDMIVSMTGGEPGWVTGLENHAAAVLDHQGLTASIVLAVALIVIAAGVFLPPPLARERADPGPRDGRVHLGVRRGVRPDPDRRRHRPELRPAAGPAGPGLLAARHGSRPGRRQRRPPRREIRMSTPAWILEIFAAMMVLVAEVSAGQLVIARAWTRRGGAGAGIAVSRLLTGIAMAGILVPGLSILPNAVWEVAFAVMTAWFAWCLWRENRGRAAAAVAHGHYAPHLVHSAAMLYMFAALAGPSAVAAPGGMSGMAWGSSGGMPTLHAPTLALIFALLLIAFTVHDLDRQAGVDGYFHAVGRPLDPQGPRWLPLRPSPPRIPRSACCFPPRW